MIRAIAAFDDKRGLATEHGIPWRIPVDIAHFRNAITGVDVLMGYATYVEFSRPLPAPNNFVEAKPGSSMRDGFEPVKSAEELIRTHQGDLWIIGGAKLYARTLEFVSELNLTRVNGNFHCTKFFPSFENQFELVSDNPSPEIPGSPDIRFQIWQRANQPAVLNT